MSLLLMQSECVSHCMRALDRCSGSAVVVISLHVGWTNLSIQFLPLVFSPMREPTLCRLLSLSASQTKCSFLKAHSSFIFLCKSSACLTSFSHYSILPWLLLVIFFYNIQLYIFMALDHNSHIGDLCCFKGSGIRYPRYYFCFAYSPITGINVLYIKLYKACWKRLHASFDHRLAVCLLLTSWPRMPLW